ncbi:hypothetical protein GE09DRAFT_1211168 [Coniochaeta sp. 2T2.1]|nr:hypothetical protein GE09DRAFT_1211168 [Coniochaeta sp. 2T2.1]
MKTTILVGFFMTALSVVAIPTPDTQTTRDVGSAGGAASLRTLQMVKERDGSKDDGSPSWRTVKEREGRDEDGFEQPPSR